MPTIACSQSQNNVFFTLNGYCTYNECMHGFTLLPDKKTEAKLIHLNQKYFREPLALNDHTAVPHVTVLQAPIRSGFTATPFLEEFKNSDLLNREPKANLSSLKYVNDHWLFFEVTNPSWLKQLNELIVHSVSDWIDVDAAPKKTEFRNEAERVSYEKTGYRYNLESYSPHFTVGVADKVDELPAVPELEQMRVPFRKLAFCEHGEHGQIVRVLESVNLPFSWD